MEMYGKSKEFVSVPITMPGTAKIGDRPVIIPWLNRSAREWFTYTTKPSATRVCFLAWQERQAAVEGWVDRWFLQEAVGVFWKEDIRTLEDEIIKSNQTFAVNSSSKFLDDLTSEVKDCFAEQPDMFPFFKAARYVIDERNRFNQSHRNNGAMIGYPELYPKVASLLGWSKDEIDVVKAHTQRLVEVFWEKTRVPILSFLRKRRSIKLEDAESILGLELSKGVMRFEWDPLVINPLRTVQQLIDYLQNSITNPKKDVFDTHSLEVDGRLSYHEPGQESMENIASNGKSTEQEALDHLTVLQIRQVISRVTRSSEEREAVYGNLFMKYTRPEIRRDLGVSEWRLDRCVAGFYQEIARMAEQGHFDVIRAIPKKKTRETERWGGLFAKIDFYRRLFSQRPMALCPKRHRLFESFLRVETGEYHSTLAALEKEYPGLKRSTLRRQVARARDELDGTIPLSETPHFKGERRHQGAQQIAWIKKHDPVFWSTFKPIQKEILERYYLQDPNQMVTISQVASDMKFLNHSSVSRHLEYCRLTIRHFYGSANLIKKSPEHSY